MNTIKELCNYGASVTVIDTEGRNIIEIGEQLRSKNVQPLYQLMYSMTFQTMMKSNIGFFHKLNNKILRYCI